MKLTAVATTQETSVQMSGVQVTLRPLNAQTIRKQTMPETMMANVAELFTAKTSPYTIGAQDVLIVTVWDHPELSLPLGQFRTDAATGTLVDEDGCFYYPFVGRIKAAGSTSNEVRERLTLALSKSLRNPQVDVKVLSYRSKKVYVGGEVKNPATHTVTDVPFTLAEAMNRAGGFLPTADLSRVVLARGERRWNLNFLELATESTRMNRLVLQDGDSLHIHHRDEAPVYVMGELHNPRSVALYHGKLSLAQAISDAGGINNASADARSIYVLRQGSTENAVDVFHLDASNPVAMVMADRFAMHPKDVVFVDAGTLVRWNKVVNLLMPTVSALTATATEVKYLGN